MLDQTKWARIAADRLVAEFSDAAVIETANYHLCSFIMAAAKVASNDPDIALRIGNLMESERKATSNDSGVFMRTNFDVWPSVKLTLIATSVSVLMIPSFILPAHARGGGAANLMNSPGYQRAQKEARERYLARYYGSQAQPVHRRKKARPR